MKPKLDGLDNEPGCRLGAMVSHYLRGTPAATQSRESVRRVLLGLRKFEDNLYNKEGTAVASVGGESGHREGGPEGKRRAESDEEIPRFSRSEKLMFLNICPKEIVTLMRE